MKKIANTKYAITKDGIVINTKTNKKLKPQNNGNGYLKVTLTVNGLQIQKYIHRLVAEYYVPKVSGKNQINHKDGCKNNNNYENLEWVTNAENQIHAHKIGLKRSGIKLWNAKFNQEDLDDIINLSKKGVKGYIIAQKKGCAKSTISDIINGKRYKYNTYPSPEKN